MTISLIKVVTILALTNEDFFHNVQAIAVKDKRGDNQPYSFVENSSSTEVQDDSDSESESESDNDENDDVDKPLSILAQVPDMISLPLAIGLNQQKQKPAYTVFQEMLS